MQGPDVNNCLKHWLDTDLGFETSKVSVDISS